MKENNGSGENGENINNVISNGVAAYGVKISM
jgi:hypothetical protein